ncbi:hypothetical protein J437_LFUL009536 [Ladona fulva]|uniref:Uncharacterized protein n=1 Tax=Ladona fulva TaxID=123851 RepID=A0A8K0P1C7_LADFU|nr:hypothetical protein J437_LFUL009536 [Ladona fulva]
MTFAKDFPHVTQRLSHLCCVVNTTLHLDYSSSSAASRIEISVVFYVRATTVKVIPPFWDSPEVEHGIAYTVGASDTHSALPETPESLSPLNIRDPDPLGPLVGRLSPETVVEAASQMVVMPVPVTWVPRHHDRHHHQHHHPEDEVPPPPPPPPAPAHHHLAPANVSSSSSSHHRSRHHHHRHHHHRGQRSYSSEQVGREVLEGGAKRASTYDNTLMYLPCLRPVLNLHLVSQCPKVSTLLVFLGEYRHSAWV